MQNEPNKPINPWLLRTAFIAVALGGGLAFLNGDFVPPQPGIVQQACDEARALGEMEPLPPIKLELALDDEAKSWLADTGEGIKGTIWFDGEGDPGHSCKTAPHRALFLGSHDFELQGEGIDVLDALSVSIRQRARLSDPNYHYTINVFSARNASPDNGLRCNAPTGRIDVLLDGDQTIRVTCSKL